MGRLCLVFQKSELGKNKKREMNVRHIIENLPFTPMYDKAGQRCFSL